MRKLDNKLTEAIGDDVSDNLQEVARNQKMSRKTQNTLYTN